MSIPAASTVQNLTRQLIDRIIKDTLSFDDFILAIKHDIQAAFDNALKVKEHLKTRDALGRTLLHHAVIQNKDSLVLKLTYYGFDIQQLDAKGNSPLDYTFIDKDPNKKVFLTSELAENMTIRKLLLRVGAMAKSNSSELKAWSENSKAAVKEDLTKASDLDLVKSRNTLKDTKSFEELRAQVLSKDKIQPYQKWLNLSFAYEIFYQMFEAESSILEEIATRSAKGALPDDKSVLTVAEILSHCEKMGAESMAKTPVEDSSLSAILNTPIDDVSLPPILTSYEKATSTADNTESQRSVQAAGQQQGILSKPNF